MTDYFIKSTSEQNFWAIMVSSGVELVTEDGVEQRIVKNGNSLDVIGVIYESTGNMLTDPEIGQFPEMAPVPGYHANLRGELTEQQLLDLAAVLIAEPATPVRVWA